MRTSFQLPFFQGALHALVDHVDILCNLLRVLLFLPARGRDHQIAFRKGIELAEVTDAALGKLHGGAGRPLRKKGVIGPFCIIPFRIHGMERLRENILREKTASPSGRRSIVEAVEANPAKAKQVRRFANYYLPDAVNVLQQYAKLAKQGVRGENAAAIRAEVEHNAASIATAFENQLDALYAAESMDLSADLTVLQNMLKGQGLSK